MEISTQKNSKGVQWLINAGLVYAAAIWGSTFVIVKDTVQSVSPHIVVGYRFTLAAICMALLCLALRQRLFAHAGKGLMLGICLFFIYSPQTAGLAFTTASNSAFITGLFVIFVPLFAWLFFKQRPGLQKILAVVIACIGLWVLTGGLHEINNGDVMTLITAAAYGMHIILGDRYMKSGCDPYVLSFQQFAVTAVISIGVAIVTGAPFVIMHKSIGIIVFLALFPTLSAFLIQMIVQRRENPVKVAIVFSLEPVFAAMFAWTVGNETFLPLRALGGLLIVGAMIFAELPIFSKQYKKD